MKYNREPVPLLDPNKQLTDNGKPLGFSALDYWRFQFSNIWDAQEEVAEFIVAKALGLELPHNKNGWPAYDIQYKGKRVEIKSSSYFHSWRAEEDDEDKGKYIESRRRDFGIAKTQGQHNEKRPEPERQNDVYVFCLNLGNTFEDSDPFEMSHWKFYVVPTARINAECGGAKKISLTHIEKLTNPIPYHELRSAIDAVLGC